MLIQNDCSKFIHQSLQNSLLKLLPFVVIICLFHHDNVLAISWSLFSSGRLTAGRSLGYRYKLFYYMFCSFYTSCRAFYNYELHHHHQHLCFIYYRVQAFSLLSHISLISVSLNQVLPAIFLISSSHLAFGHNTLLRQPLIQ